MRLLPTAACPPTQEERNEEYRRFVKGKGSNLPTYVVTPMPMCEDVRLAALTWA